MVIFCPEKLCKCYIASFNMKLQCVRMLCKIGFVSYCVIFQSEKGEAPAKRQKKKNDQTVSTPKSTGKQVN